MNLSRVAAKRLTTSDLTLFEAQFKKDGQRSKQKGINLNANVFVNIFYPGLRDRLAEIHFGITIVGPSAAPAITLSRKAIRSKGAKNWRLNGELISNPSEMPNRFNSLSEGDIGVLAFEGSEKPEQVTLILISAASDTALHRQLLKTCEFQARDTMRVLREEDIRELVNLSNDSYINFHPLEDLLFADNIEEALYGVAGKNTGKGNAKDGRGMLITQDSIRRQVIAAGETGQLGEEIFERWLLSTGLTEDDFDWVSQDYGRAAFDFFIKKVFWEKSSKPKYVDVKSTRAPHETAFHVSTSELYWAANHSEYQIARISSLTSNSARIEILGGLPEIAKSVIQVFEQNLLEGIIVDSIAISPHLLRSIYTDIFKWSTED